MNPFGAAFMDLTGIAGSARLARQQSSLQNMAAYQNHLQGFAQADPYRNVGLGLSLNPRAAAPAKERTYEEILEQLEARYAEMEADAERKAQADLTACSACRWSSGNFCTQPLVTGITQAVVYVWDNPTFRPGLDDTSRLCGPEKALWELPEPKRTIWQRFVDWFLQPWRDDLAQINRKG